MRNFEKQDKMDEYKEVEKQMGEIIDKRMDATNINHEWNYNKEVGKNLQMQPFKYQNVDMETNVQFTDDLRKIIYNEKNFPEDIRVFTSSDWHLAPVTENVISPPTVIPSGAYIRAKKIDGSQVDLFYGKVQQEGRLKGKSNQINYNSYYFNLRSNALVIYKNQQIDSGEKQLFYIPLNENTYDYLSDATQFMFLKGQDKNLKIFKDQNSRELVKNLERKLLFYSFRGAYGFRNQVPDWRVEDYISEQIDTVGPIDFSNENLIKNIVNNKIYREAIGGFFKLLQKTSRKRNNKAGQIYFPRWLKQQFRDIPIMQTWLATNIIPPQNQLMSLKIKVNQNEKKGLLYAVKFIFPYIKNYIKRSIIVYQSQLVNEQVVKILQNISFPFHTIGFPRNQLSQQALEITIKKSSDFQNEVVDLSYNKRLLTISGKKILDLTNSNPTVKKILLRGCQIANGQQDVFFDALSSNLVLQQIELQYHQSYNESMVHFLNQFQAIIQ